MTPIELFRANIQRKDAWRLYHALCDEYDPAPLADRNKARQVAEAFDVVYQDWYARWQAVGGTSDIGSIVEAEAWAVFADEQIKNTDEVRTPEQIAFDEKCRKFDWNWYYRDTARVDAQVKLMEEAKNNGLENIYEQYRQKSKNLYCPICDPENPNRPLEDDEFQSWHDEPGYY